MLSDALSTLRGHLMHFSFEDLAQKDFFASLGLWIVLEIISFLILPAFGAVSAGTPLKAWFLLSFPFGVGGALLVSASSHFIALTNQRAYTREGKTIASFLGQFGGWIGFAGILFPFAMVLNELITKVFVK